jgi:hypothetical protein
MADLPPVAEDQNFLKGATAHSRYMVKNYLARNPDTPHREEPNNPWYTDEGAKAAPKAEEVGPGPLELPSVSIDGWIDAPFHRLGLIQRDLGMATYGHYCEGDVCAGNLVLESKERTDDPLWTGKFPDPIMFPANDTTLPSNLSVLLVDEWPEPLSLSCSGYRRPNGYPITLQFDQRFVPKLLSFELTRNGVPMEACGYDSTSYANSDESARSWASEVLKDYAAVVLIPRESLNREAKYAVTINVEAQSDPFSWGSPSPFAGQTRRYEWSFSIAP